ncbi:hypothetical protein ACWGH2_41875 [Streptomyces sp. NPDC054871]
MLFLRTLYTRARAAAAVAGLLALLFLAGAATFGAARADGTPRPTATVGDDNRDGRIDEDESGWDCRTMGNRVCGPDTVPAECRDAGDATALCVRVAGRPAYGWTNPDGSRADNPDGRAMVRDLEEQPGTREFAAALRALDAEWNDHH